MGRKQVTKAFKALEVEMDGDHVGEETTTEQLDRATYFVFWDGGVANDGEFRVEVTQDDETWQDLPFAPPLIIDTPSGGAIVQVNDITWLKMRPKFVDNSAGAGVGSLIANVKCSTAGA